MSQWSSKIAIFGGTFDPPHLGHLEAARGLLQNPGVRQVWITPTASPAYRGTLASAEHRLEMARLQFSNTKDIKIDEREILRTLTQLTPNPSYTYDTLLELKQEGVPAAFVLGTDQLEKLHTWHRFPELLGLADWIVLARKPQRPEAILNTLQLWKNQGLSLQTSNDREWSIQSPTGKASLIWVETPAAEISSTSIREYIARHGSPPENSLHPDVWSYLKKAGLYGTPHL